MRVFGRREETIRTSFAGQAYGALIESQVDEERALKASIETRATAVITSSGVLVTLLFALRAVVFQGGDELGEVARYLLAGSLAAFVGAAVGAILANRPRDFEEADLDGLSRLTREEFWLGPIAIGSRRSAELGVQILRKARSANRAKATALAWAFHAQLLAIGFLALALASELILRG